MMPNFGKERTLECLRRMRACLEGHDCEIMMHPNHKDSTGDCADIYDYNVERMLSLCDAVVAIGGDGTTMHAAKLAAEANKPILGINTGRLGFITSFDAGEPERIMSFITGDYTEEERMMLDVEVLRGGRIVSQRHSLNDAVVSRGALSRIIDLRVCHNGRPALEFRADGLIVSTPTGSTAYSMSAGGPIIDPAVRCIELTPVCTHSLMDRSIIFDSGSVLTIEACRRDDDLCEQPCDGVSLAVDGELATAMAQGDIIRIKRSDISARFITIKKQSFANALLEKFQTQVGTTRAKNEIRN